MNTHIGCIARYQSHLGGFKPSYEPIASLASYSNGDGDGASSFDNEATTLQWSNFFHHDKKRE